MNAPLPKTVATLVALTLGLSACGGSDETTTISPGGIEQERVKPPAEFGRNVVRLSGISPADVAGTAIMAAYPPERDKAPSGWVLVDRQRWQELMVAAQFAAKPVQAGVLPIEKDFLPSAAADLVSRTKVPGFPKADGLKVLVLGKAGQDVFADLKDAGLKLSLLESPNYQRTAAQAVPFRGGWAKTFSANIVIVSAEDADIAYALPGAAWSAFSGDSVAFVTRGGVPKATNDMLVQRQKLKLEKPVCYLFAPTSVISSAVATQLQRNCKVRRIPGETPVQVAAEFARYKDPATGFGWGLKRAPISVSLVNTSNPANAVGAFALAGAGPHAPLLLIREASELPKPVRDYLSDVRGPRASQGFVLGDERSITGATLKALDRALDAE